MESPAAVSSRQRQENLAPSLLLEEKEFLRVFSLWY